MATQKKVKVRKGKYDEAIKKLLLKGKSFGNIAKTLRLRSPSVDSAYKRLTAGYDYSTCSGYVLLLLDNLLSGEYKLCKEQGGIMFTWESHKYVAVLCACGYNYDYMRELLGYSSQTLLHVVVRKISGECDLEVDPGTILTKKLLQFSMLTLQNILDIRGLKGDKAKVMLAIGEIVKNWKVTPEKPTLFQRLKNLFLLKAE